MALREIRSYRQDLIVGASLTVWPPLGQYDESRLINIGTHRWSVKPEIGASKAFGPWIVELIGAAQLYEDNDDFLGNNTREQDPVYSVQGGGIRTFASGAWLALSATYFKGGRTTVDGVRGRDLKENSRVGLTFPCRSIATIRSSSTRIRACPRAPDPTSMRSASHGSTDGEAGCSQPASDAMVKHDFNPGDPAPGRS